MDCSYKFGTEEAYYSLNGSAVPNKNGKGGDAWAGDVFREVMRHEKDWGVLMLTFTGIDKVLHSLGEHDEKPPYKNKKAKVHLKQALEVADQQLGKVLDYLETNNLMKETTLVVTADHGGQVNKKFHGPSAGYWAKLQNRGRIIGPSPITSNLAKLGNIKAIRSNTAIYVWLEKESDSSVKQIKDYFSKIPEVIEVYKKQKDHFLRIHQNFKSIDEKQIKWAKTYNQELVNSFASKGGPDVVALLEEGMGFGVIGQHGGAQETSQRISLFFYTPGIKPKTISNPISYSEIKPMIIKAMGLN